MDENGGTGANASVENPDREAETRRGVVRWLVREIMGVVFAGVTLFLSAGRMNWGMGWALVGVYAAWTAANALILIPRSPETLAERVSRKKFGGKSWDTIILSTLGLVTLVKQVIAGLDVRWGWTASMPLELQITALVIAALGYALGSWAMVTNAFFSMVVRIQDDRGHAVVTGGPYRYVRHPGYIGSIMFELMTPIALGSLWALIPGALAALLFVVRTALEDRTLQGELDGYQDYAAQVRYRLVPGVW